MKSVSLTVARCLLGGAFLLAGVDGLVHFLPIPPARPPAEALIGALIRTGYFFQMVKLVEIACGLLLLTHRFAPLALVLLSPILVGITSIHLFLNPEGIPLMVVLLTLHAIVVRGYWPFLSRVLTRKAVPLAA